jgi:hypothetical protein
LRWIPGLRRAMARSTEDDDGRRKTCVSNGR